MTCYSVELHLPIKCFLNSHAIFLSIKQQLTIKVFKQAFGYRNFSNKSHLKGESKKIQKLFKV